MFIFSIRASSIKFFGILALTLAVLIGIMLSGETVFASASGEAKLSGIRNEEDRIALLETFGIKVEGEPEIKEFILPENFDRVMTGYNELQRSQGLDLTKYAKKRVARYTYKISNWSEISEEYLKNRVTGGEITDNSDENGTEGTQIGDESMGSVCVSLFIYRNRVIALDISSSEYGGFVLPVLKRSV